MSLRASLKRFFTKYIFTEGVRKPFRPVFIRCNVILTGPETNAIKLFCRNFTPISAHKSDVPDE